MSVFRHAQCLHPKRKTYSCAANTISNLSLKLTAALENQLSPVFGTSDAKESIFDMFRNHWMAYRNEPLTDEIYNLSKENRPTSSHSQCPYW